MKVGDTVFYYENVASGVPTVAIIERIHSLFLADLIVWDGAQFVARGSLHHRACAAVKSNPNITSNRGAWSLRDPGDDENLVAEMDEHGSAHHFAKSA